jgi:hypothetical protein
LIPECTPLASSVAVRAILSELIGNTTKRDIYLEFTTNIR